ncbi:cytokine receptor isoform X2 [Ceratitis capitata]|uniref:cytokine receptor isoform X2 n=1 Tax=Ceratitis capitata TaxID=7213 RepID=UPI000329E521|nr:cytokine receptor isoform X2 [Ceratitis capitata]
MNMKCCLFAILYCILTQWMILKVYAQSPGETSPRIVLQIGDSANITCRMNLKMFDGENSSSLYFTTDDSNHQAVHTNVKIINETTIAYTLKNATEQYTIYTCKSGQYAIATTDVIVGTKPTKVEDFSCQAFDYTYMICSFTIPKNTVPTTYNLKYVAENANYILNCIKLVREGDRATCNFTLEDGSYKRDFEFYNFRLTSNNSLGSLNQSFTINHKEIVKPAITNYQVSEITTNSCALKWEMLHYYPYKRNGLQMEVHIQSPHYENLKVHICKKCNNHAVFNLYIDDLPYAYYEYNVSLRIKMRRGKATWSDPYTIAFRTLPKAPEVPPTVDMSSFYLNGTHLRLFWHPVAEYHRNGSNFHYIVKHMQQNGVAINRSAIHTEVSTAAFSCDGTYSCEFSIWSSNEMGVSLLNSRVYVPALPKNYDSHTPLGIRNVYHALDRNYTLFWNAPQDAKYLENYTVFWCQPKSVASNECYNIIDFTHLDKNARNFTIQQNQSVVLAVAANYPNFYTGMHWAKCTADVSNDLEKLEPEIVDKKAYSMTVRWSSERVCASLIKGYKIEYCRTKFTTNLKCIDKIVHLNVDKRDNKYEITNLEPNSVYKMQMFMYSDEKKGPLSDVLVMSTQEAASAPPRNLTYAEVTSQSVSLAWLAPEKANGKIRYYIITYNRENNILKCNNTIGPNCFNLSHSEHHFNIEHLSYTLTNLSSFTRYIICIKAYTVAESLPSNCVNVKTFVGVPTSPTQVKVDDADDIAIRWRKPEVPSGRVDYYEVIVETKLQDTIQSRYISRIANGMQCTIRKPNCDNTNIKYTISVRSVNIAYANETDEKLFHHYNNSQRYDNYINGENEDLGCMEAATPQLYKDAMNGANKQSIEYRSVEVNVFNSICIAMVKADGKLWLIIFCIIMGTAGLVIGGLFIYRRCHQMASINCKIPDTFEDLVKRNDDKILRTLEHTAAEHSDETKQKNSSEYGRLLPSISNDTEYSYDGSDRSWTIGSKSTYCPSIDSPTDYCVQDPMTIANTQFLHTVPETGYVIMNTPTADLSAQPKESTNVASVFNPTIMSNGYVRPNDLPQNMVEKPFTIKCPFGATDGYVQPNSCQT